jgi:hypothetical protein
MLVSELRELIKKYKEEDLRLVISEMYKSMPKKLREEKDIDEMLQDVHAYLRIGKVEKEQNKKIDIDKLKQQIDLFIDYAYKQYYFAPNSYIHKKERPKWRFIVKSYIKDLQKLPKEGEEGRTATSLLEKLYEMLSYACHYYIFSTENPFRSVGIDQTEFLDIVIARKLGAGINVESIKSSIMLVINSNVDRETLHSSLIDVLVMNLKTPDSREMAIKQCIIIKDELKGQRPAKKTWDLSTYEYEQEEKINNLVETVFNLYIALYEYESAIKYFKRNYISPDKEVSLYVLLFMLFQYDLKEYWISEYEEALKKGVKPRIQLQKTYEYILENDKLPEYIH